MEGVARPHCLTHGVLIIKLTTAVFIGRKLVPFAAGLIVGEALTQLVWNLWKLGVM